MRTELKNAVYTLAYGTDEIVGLFLEILRIGETKFSNTKLWTQRKDKLTMEKLVEIAEEYGFDLSHELDDGTGWQGSGCGGGCETCQRLGV